MANESFHRSVQIREILESKGHKLVFLPPYSPFFHLIENLFSQMKSLVRKQNTQTKEDLLRYTNDFKIF